MPATERHRVAILGLMLESNRFAPVITEADYLKRVYLTGPEIIADLQSPDPTLPGWNATSFAATPDHTLFPEFVTLDLGPQCFALREVVLWRPLPAAQTAACGFPTNFSVAVSDNQAAAWRDALEAALLPPLLRLRD